jgi:uncharacterized protein (TIGR02466 family)
MTHKIVNIFPTPIYVAKRETEATTSELEDIKSIIEKASEKETGSFSTGYITKRLPQPSQKHPGYIISSRKNTHLFDTKLNSLKAFCDQHINTYVNTIINPKNTELDFFITQSWLNIVHPGESHPVHCHTNSIISGVFYVSAVEDDAIQFYDPGSLMKNRTEIEMLEATIWSAPVQNLDIHKNELILFPSWLGHGVTRNASNITNRISIAFNVFLKGSIGEEERMTELVL